MKNEYKVIIVILVVLVTIVASKTSLFNDKIEKVCLTRCFDVEVADNQVEMERGLMNRTSLDENSGMLFVFDKEGKYPFWMKNTLIELDIIWLDKDLRVVEITTAYPCTSEECELYGGNFDSLYVLEINSDQAEDLGIRIGDIARLE